MGETDKVNRARKGVALLRKLSRKERMLLMRFVCSFVWADLRVTPRERELVARLVHRLHLDEKETKQVLEWLASPPEPEAVDPALIPRARRRQFLKAVALVVSVDGQATQEERDSLAVFARLLRR